MDIHTSTDVRRSTSEFCVNMIYVRTKHAIEATVEKVVLREEDIDAAVALFAGGWGSHGAKIVAAEVGKGSRPRAVTAACS